MSTAAFWDTRNTGLSARSIDRYMLAEPWAVGPPPNPHSPST